MVRPVVSIVLAFVLLSTFVAAEEQRTFQVRGTVLGPVENGEILIEHDEIPGYMPAMTMPFIVAHPHAADVRALTAGDVVEFRWTVGESSSASHFRVLRRGTPHARSPLTGPAVLQEGEVVPDFSLIDQSEQVLTAAALEGHFTVLSFLFTRCPVPEFCPWLAARYAELLGKIQASERMDDVQLLSVTIDPEYDTPAVLRAYGEHWGADFARWRFATGPTDEVTRLRQRFAVRAVGAGAALDHTLATVLIGPDRRVLHIWRGNQWKTADVLAAIQQATERATAGARGGSAPVAGN